MARSYSKRLTKEMLKEMGIYDIYWDVDNNEWWIDRYWFRYGRSKEKSHQRIKVQYSVTKHKYTQDKAYPTVVFNYGNKTMTFPLSRLLYAWFKGEVPEGLEVDHIDNNPLNNSLDNLQLLTIEENLRKRYSDNPNGNLNQYR